MLMKEVLGFPLVFWLLSVCVYSFTLLNGFLDGCNAVATLIASRAMKPKTALRFAATIELLSPMTLFFTGFTVSKTIQTMVDENYYTGDVDQTKALCFIAGGILAAIIWDLFAFTRSVKLNSRAPRRNCRRKHCSVRCFERCLGSVCLQSNSYDFLSSRNRFPLRLHSYENLQGHYSKGKQCGKYRF